MKALAIVGAALCGGAFAMEPPVVSDVTLVQPEGTRKVTITYALSGAPGIVTLDIETNGVDAAGVTRWASIGLSNVTHVTGDAFRLVQPGAARQMHWAPQKAWAGHTVTDPNRVRAVVKAVATNTPPDYMVCNLVNGARFYYDDVSQLPGGIDSDAYRTHLYVMRKVHAKGQTFLMGTPKGQRASVPSDTPHLVGFTEDYYLGVFETTRHQVALFRGTVPTEVDDTRPWEVKEGGNSGFPADGFYSSGMIPFPDGTVANDYAANASDNGILAKARARTGLGVYLFLPTEAQWEFACRAGRDADFNDGGNLGEAGEATNAHLDELGRYKGNGTGTARVGSYRPNAWGLYDMHGNVSEWCADRAGVSDKLKIPSAWKTGETLVDPRGYSDGDVGEDRFRHFARGGNWNSTPRACRSTSRSLYYQIWQEACEPYCGLRLIYQLDRETVDAPSSETSVELTSLASAVRSSATGETGAFDSRFASSAASEGAIELLTDPLGQMIIVR